MIDRIRQIGERLVGYSWWQVGIELAVIGIVVYLFVRFVATARAPRSVKLAFYLFLIATLLIRVLGARESFQRVGFLYDSVLPVVILALLVIFQPELRRAMMRAGDFSFLRRRIEPETRAVEEIVKAAKYLSRAKFGAIIVVERETSLRNMLEGGTVLNAEVSAPLLQTIFFPGSALHDLAVVIKGDRILAAGVQLPLAEATEMEDASLGSRHRAAVGVSAESDAVVVVVSEETGLISLAERGELTRGLNEDELRSLLILKYNRGLVTELTTGEAVPESSPRESNPALGETTFGDEPVLEGQRR
ncbi:MAG: TIGR00159 family protein [Phycisphaerales bacterium]|nr:TIGR00159 family protein [Phycisphaerales bacterium]